ncbi:DUF418 domain-containing protein [Spirosoma montaniterrae]|uniref:DUF418 domain-containing protein n=1 Tax=Spirosoma montaniterrae TaxID=1178516 RepID=A0A1P9WSU3_9BACT|nr:DUF418 domain-containing protein [Spirosoma montaniterrae]AQG78432.1 hypothetical protein AWR27_03210 [Spirosoma montaniterrae]
MESAGTLTHSLQTDKTARIQVVDALRGFALFGILVAHTCVWFDGGPLPGSVYAINGEGVANTIVQTFTGIFVSGKFYTFFSFLFGLSFALMLTRSTDSDGSFLRRFAWRLVILGAIGLLHHLHWRGDILSIYAMLGFPLLLFRNAPTRLILVVSILLVLNVPVQLRNAYTSAFVTPPGKAQSEQQQKADEKLVAANYEVIQHGSYADVVRVNWREFETKMKFQFDSGRIYITLGFFLLGLYAGRRRLYQHLSEHRALFRKLTKYCGFSVLGIILLFIATISILGNNTQPPKAIEVIFSVLFDLGNAALTVFYIAGLTLLFQRVAWQRVASPLASVGKMALTNYVLQSIIGTLIFYGYGLGLIGKIDTATAALFVLPVFAVQVLFSRWWLSRFQYGPLEWLWRSLTYLKAQPMVTHQAILTQ